jgi:hypothetical protein
MKHTLGILIASCAAALLCSPARANTILSIQPLSVSVAAGSMGDAFDVVLTNSGPASISVASFAFEVSVTDTDITFTAADFSTGAFSYIFVGDSFDVINAFTLNTNGPGETLDASDLTNDGAGITLISGASLALGEVLFNVSPTAAPGTFTVSFTGMPIVSDANNLSNPAGNAIAIDNFSSGSITIGGGSSVPEPSSLLLSFAGMAALVGLRVRGRRRCPCR